MPHLDTLCHPVAAYCCPFWQRNWAEFMFWGAAIEGAAGARAGGAGAGGASSGGAGVGGASSRGAYSGGAGVGVASSEGAEVAAIAPIIPHYLTRFQLREK
ncbi:unnamed protein product [Closterium sp. NIES-54]